MRRRLTGLRQMSMTLFSLLLSSREGELMAYPGQTALNTMTMPTIETVQQAVRV
jgi:hypothetical protein